MGKFIVIEGPDGTGKSTVIEGLKKNLPKDLKVMYIREPGGSDFGEKMREIILSKSTEIEDETEALLFCAMRSENVAMIKRELPNYDLIISDRFLLSSLCYQGAGLGLGIEKIKELNDFCLKGFRPDLNIVLMIDANEGLKRKEIQKDLDRLEERGEAFHRKVNDAYRLLSKEEGNFVVNARLPKEEVLERIMTLILDSIK